MTKITIKPSEEIVAQAVKPVTVVDSTGRSITLQKPGVLAQFRMIEMLGESAKNQVYLGMVLPLIFVTAIDDSPVAKPTTKRELEALIQTLSDEGVEAVMAGVNENFGASNPDADKDALKNS